MSGEPKDDVDVDAETAEMFEELGVAFARWHTARGTQMRFQDVQHVKALIRARLERIVAAARATKSR